MKEIFTTDKKWITNVPFAETRRGSKRLGLLPRRHEDVSNPVYEAESYSNDHSRLV